MKSDTYRKTELPVPGHTADNPPHQAGYFEMDPEIGISVFVSPPDAPINRMSIQEILRLEQDSLTPDP